MAAPTPSTFGRTLRVLCAALMSSLVVILVAVSVVLSGDGTGAAPVWAYGVLVVVAALEATLIPVVGYRFTPVAPGTEETEARRSSTTQVQTFTILRFALAEAVGLVGVALAFVVRDGGISLVVIGVAAAEVLMFVHVWPGERMITKVTESLESQGGRSYLREALEDPPPARNG